MKNVGLEVPFFHFLCSLNEPYAFKHFPISDFSSKVPSKALNSCEFRYNPIAYIGKGTRGYQDVKSDDLSQKIVFFSKFKDLKSSQYKFLEFF